MNEEDNIFKKLNIEDVKEEVFLKKIDLKEFQEEFDKKEYEKIINKLTPRVIKLAFYVADIKNVEILTWR